jgi:FAD/FMN-containing dehydrogenase
MTAVKTPACIFKPDNTNDLAKVVKQLQQNNIKFAIRSGGHLPSPGAANIDDGVLIDLGGFNRVDYDAKQNTATVGSGSRWQAVYEQLDPFNVTVVGGRVLEVGVGGLTLGGMFLSTTHPTKLLNPNDTHT